MRAEDHAFLLSLLLWTPFAVGLLALVLPERLGRSAGLLAAAAPLGLVSIGGASVTRGWLPFAGASYELALDGLSVALVAVTSVVALVSVVAAGPHGSRRGTLAATLVGETALIGIFCSGDALLLTAFLGAAIGSFSVLSSSRGFAFAQWIGFCLVLGLFSFCYHEAWAQSGFTTSSLARFEGLVLFPELERWAFLAGVLGPLIMMLGARPSSSDLDPARRSPFLAAYAIVPGFLLFRLVGPVFPAGAAEHASLMSATGVGFILMASFARPVRLDYAFQGLFLLGLFSLTANGIVAAEIEWLHMALAVAAWDASANADASASGRPGRLAPLVVALVLLPPSAGLLLATLSSAPTLAASVALAWLLFALVVVRAAAAGRRVDGTPAVPLPLVLLLAVSPLAYLAPYRYHDTLERTVSPLLSVTEMADEESE